MHHCPRHARELLLKLHYHSLQILSRKTGATVDDKRRERIEKIKERKAVLDARLRQEYGRERARERKVDTRRKILAGAAVLSEAAERPQYHAQLMRLLTRFLTKPEDRALFGLPPLSQDGTDSAADNSTEVREAAVTGFNTAERELVSG